MSKMEKIAVMKDKTRLKKIIKLCDLLLKSREFRTAKLLILKTLAEGWLEEMDLAKCKKISPQTAMKITHSRNKIPNVYNLGD